MRQRQRYLNKLEQFAAQVDLFVCRPRCALSVDGIWTFLKPLDRDLLVDHFIYGRTFVELADKYNLSQEAAKKNGRNGR